MKRYFKKILLVLAVLIFTACNSDIFYFEKDSVKDEVWNMDTKYIYDVNITDSLQLYNFFVDVRNTNDYPYANIFFFIKTTFPAGGFALDTIECMLADPTGKWLGKGSGRIYDNMFLFRENVIFPQTGKYVFEITHGMRDTIVQGISEVGLRIDYAR